MTTRTILFDSPFLLGFDHTRAQIDRAARAAADSYPPYNVEQRGERAVRITLAVAGFSPDDLAVTVEGRQLGRLEGVAKHAVGCTDGDAGGRRQASRGSCRIASALLGEKQRSAASRHGSQR